MQLCFLPGAQDREGTRRRGLCGSLDEGSRCRALHSLSLLHSLYSRHSSLSWSTKYAVVVIIIVIMFFEIGSHYKALGVLDLAIQTRLASKSQTQRSTCLCLSDAGIQGICHHIQPNMLFAAPFLFFYVKTLNFQKFLSHLIFLFILSVLGAGHDIHLRFDQSLVSFTISSTVCALLTLFILFN